MVEFDDEAAARTAVDDEDVDGALLAGDDELLVRESAGGTLEAIVQGAVGQVAVAEQLTDAGISELDVPEVAVTALDADAAADSQRVVAAVFGVVILYSLLILFGQFIAQGVVEEKSSRVVELLLATMRPWQLLAGKILGLGLLALGQIVAIGVVAVGRGAGLRRRRGARRPDQHRRDRDRLVRAGLRLVRRGLRRRRVAGEPAGGPGDGAHADVDGAHRRVLHRHPGRRPTPAACWRG